MTRFLPNDADEPDWWCRCGPCPARWKFCPDCKMEKPNAKEQQERLERIHGEHPRPSESD